MGGLASFGVAGGWGVRLEIQNGLVFAEAVRAEGLSFGSIGRLTAEMAEFLWKFISLESVPRTPVFRAERLGFCGLWDWLAAANAVAG